MVDRDALKYSVVSDEGLSEIHLEGSPTILIVDDEDLMREVVTIMIEENGGQALEAADGDEAVELFAANRDRIDCVFLDYSMPRMNGYLSYLEMRKIKPDVGIIVVSGLGVVPEVEELYRKREIEFLSKPFHEVELIKTINMLQRKRRPA